MTCYLCDPENPDADEEGCAKCEQEYWDYIAKHTAYGQTMALREAVHGVGLAIYQELLRFRIFRSYVRWLRK